MRRRRTHQRSLPLTTARLVAAATMVLLIGAGISAAQAQSEPIRLVLAVGNNVGLETEIPLRYATRDAKSFATVMIESGRVRSEHVRLLEDRPLTDIPKAIEDLLKRAGDGEVELFFFYSGHADDKHLHIEGRKLPIATIKKWLSKIRARLRVAIIDACRGEDIRPKGSLTREPAFAVKLAAPEGVRGVVTLRSSSTGESSQESQTLRGAIFTHYLITAMKGAADHDRDRQVTLDEAYRYAYRQTVRRSAASAGGVMHPSADVDIEGAGDLVLTHTRRATAEVVLPADRDAQYLLFRRPAGAVVAEIWAEPDRPVELRVSPGAYLLQRRARGRSGAHEFRVGKGGTETVADNDFQAVPENVLAAKGGSLRLWAHELRAGYAALLTHATSLGHRIRLRYAFGGMNWSVGVGVEAGLTNYQGAVHDRRERWLGGDIRVEFKELLGPLDLGFGAVLRAVDQRLTRPDADTIGPLGYDTTREFVGLAGGPTLALAYRARLGLGWYMHLELNAQGLLREEGSNIAFRPEGGFELSVGVEL